MLLQPVFLLCWFFMFCVLLMRDDFAWELLVYCPVDTHTVYDELQV